MEAIKAPYSNKIWKISNPIIAQNNLNKYFGKEHILYLSDKKDKKYYILDPSDKKVYFGSSEYEDFTKHQNLRRRISYLNRATNIKGDWEQNKYSPNCLAINVLW